MFGMNAKDAQGYMEDVAVINSAHLAAEERDLIGHAEVEAQRRRSMMNTMEGVATFVGIKERDNRIATLQQDRNNQTIHATALQKTLEHVVRDFAKLAGVSSDQLMARYNAVRTQHYNLLVNEGMEKEWFDKDPRLAITEKTKWYVRGLDADRGF